MVKSKDYPFKTMTKKLRKGAFTAKANKAGMSVARYATKIVDKYEDQKWKRAANPREALKTYRQAVLAKVFERIGRKEKRRDR